MSLKNSQLLSSFKRLIPNLHKDLRKGQCGRIGVLGGSKEYTGAPYFAAISSLKVGADLTYVLTTQDASIPIKSYSPELIVLPVLGSEDYETDMRNWISKLDSLVIGPGLGRSDDAFKYFKDAISIAKPLKIPIVIDADGLYFVTKDISLISGYERCILSPNIIEFKRLYDTTINDGYDELKGLGSVEDQCKAVEKLSIHLKNVTIFKKGKIDVISNGRETVFNDTEASLKRCGGVGDLLSGTLGTFINWCNKPNDKLHLSDKSNIIAAFNASIFIRECSRRAFIACHRSVIATDVLSQIPQTFYDIFECLNE